MAITGKFEADFESFHREVVKADGELRAFTASSGNVVTSFGRMSDTGGGALMTFHQGLSQADKTLAAFGVHIGPEIQAMRELGEASGKTVTQIGAIGTAGLVAGAALAGWKIGRLIADFFDLDKAISNAASSLMGWGDLAAETAAAKAEVLARATKNAGREITDYTEAVKINIEAAQQHADSFDTARARVSHWQNEIRTVRKNGDLEALRKELEAGNSTVKELSQEYGISTRAIEYFARQTKEATAAQKELAATQAAYGKLMSQVQNEIGIAQMNAAKAAMDQMRASADANAEGLRLMQLDLIKFEEDTAAAANTARQQEYDAWFKAVNEGVLIVGQAIGAVDAEVTASLARTNAAVTSAVTSWSQAMQAVNAGQGILSGTVTAGGPFQATREQIQRSFNQGKYWGPVDQFGNPDWAKILPGGGTTINVNASNSFYTSSAGMQQLADTVDRAVTESMRRKGYKV